MLIMKGFISFKRLQESINVLHRRVTGCGFRIGKDEIFTSLVAARKFVEDRKLRPMLMLAKEALEDFEGVNVTNPNAVVIGLAPSEFHFERLNEAFKLVLNGAQLVAIHKGRYYKRADGLALGPGPFVAALEYATGAKVRFFVVAEIFLRCFEFRSKLWNLLETPMIGVM
ncbi:HAD hydrolase family [Ostertagia ostertagi]